MRQVIGQVDAPQPGFQISRFKRRGVARCALSFGVITENAILAVWRCKTEQMRNAAIVTLKSFECQPEGIVKVRDVIQLIEADGWRLVATRGSHRQYKHPTKPGRVTIAGHPRDDLAPGTLNSVLKQAQLTKSSREE